MMIEVLEEINQSDLPASTKANALALLSLAHHDNGHCMISWQDLSRVFGHISVARSRRHLGMMQATGLIHYSSNGDDMIYVNFKAWTRVGARNMTTEWSKNDQSVVEKRASTRDPQQEEANDDLTTIMGARKTTTDWSENARGRAKNDNDLYASAGAVVSQLVSTDPLPGKELTNSLATPGPQLSPKRQVWEAPLSYRLLTDKRIAMSPKQAERLAAAHPYHHIRDAVAHWWDGRKSVGGQFDERPGVVIFWLDNPEEFTIPVMSQEFARTDLYRCYRTPEEEAAEQAALEAQRQADADPAPPAAATEPRYEPEEDTPEWAWMQVQRELAIEQGGTFDRWVDGARFVDHDPDTNTFTIALPDAYRYDWIVNRLSKQINRKLAVITRQMSAQTKFIIDPEKVRAAQGDNA